MAWPGIGEEGPGWESVARRVPASPSWALMSPGFPKLRAPMGERACAGAEVPDPLRGPDPRPRCRPDLAVPPALYLVLRCSRRGARASPVLQAGDRGLGARAGRWGRRNCWSSRPEQQHTPGFFLKEWALFGWANVPSP